MEVEGSDLDLWYFKASPLFIPCHKHLNIHDNCVHLVLILKPILTRITVDIINRITYQLKEAMHRLVVAPDRADLNIVKVRLPPPSGR